MPISEERKKLLWEIAREAGLDLLFWQGLPWIKKKMGKPITPEDRAVIAQAREHVSKGEHAEARKLLVRHMMGWGLYDEEMLEEDLGAVDCASLATPVQVSSLDKWLAADQRRRTRFRSSLTLQENPHARMRVIAGYAKMSDAQRLARLTATGKLDPSFDEAVWNWVKVNVPGVSREVWDAICEGTATLASGLGACVTGSGAAGGFIARGARKTRRGLVVGGKAIGRAVSAIDQKADEIGLEWQAQYPASPKKRPGTLYTALLNSIN